MTRRANILAPRSVGALRAFASSNVVVAFDYDGVLAPIAITPDRGRMRAGTRRLLVRAARHYPCIVLSGRRLDDLTPRLDGIPLRMIFGNFGHEPAPPGTRPPAEVAQWVSVLTRTLSPHDGVVIEDKGYSVAVHYRRARHERRARQAIADAVRDLRGAQILNGSKAVSLLPRGGPDKGLALQSARRSLGCDTAIYVGDDGTDEAAFESASPERLLSIRVGRTGETGARFRLAKQADVDAMLRVLLALRTEAAHT